MNRMTAGWLLALWTAGGYGVIALSAPTVIAALWICPVVLYAPGRLILSDLRIERDPVETLAGSVILSLCVTIYCGFVLNILDSLTQSGWLLAEALAMLGLLLIGPGHDVRLGVAAGGARLPRPTAPVLFVGLAAFVMFGAAILLAASDAERERPFPVLQMWLLQDRAANAVEVGVRNGEATEAAFDLELRGEGRMIASYRDMHVAAGATVKKIVQVTPERSDAERIEAVLLKPGEPRIMRHAHVTISRRLENTADSDRRD